MAWTIDPDSHGDTHVYDPIIGKTYPYISEPLPYVKEMEANTTNDPNVVTFSLVGDEYDKKYGPSAGRYWAMLTLGNSVFRTPNEAWDSLVPELREEIEKCQEMAQLYITRIRNIAEMIRNIQVGMYPAYEPLGDD